MGHKVHPVGFRLGIFRDWESRWYARNSYGKQLLEDLKVRRYLRSALANAEVSKIEIEKAGENIRVIVFSGRPGVVIGQKGQEINALRNNLAQLLGKQVGNVEVSVQEVKNPELDARLVAASIAEPLSRKGASFKKIMKRAATTAIKNGAKGVKICCSGRLGGAEIARQEWTRVGSIPLHTLRADVDYGFTEALTTYGIIGVKVWICRGEFQPTAR